MLKVMRISLLFVLLVGSRIYAEEGFWPFNMIPRAEMEKQYGVKITDAWLEKVRMLAEKFPGRRIMNLKCCLKSALNAQGASKKGKH